jgi:hypothetical protein
MSSKLKLANGWGAASHYFSGFTNLSLLDDVNHLVGLHILFAIQRAGADLLSESHNR